MLRGHTMLNGMPRGSSMISTRCVRVVSFRKMEVEEPWLGLWLPLNYQVDMGSSLAYDNGIWGEPYRLFAAKFLFVGVFLVCAKGGLRNWKCGSQALWLI